jgi:CRISPR-associated protein Csb1
MATMEATTTEQVSSYLSAALGGEGPESARWASAVRLRCRLQPAGGPGTKVMPPTYSGDRGPTYVREERVIGDANKACVSLDSAPSQANRLEEALSGSLEAGEVHVPNIWVDQGKFGEHSALDFSHRAFDAWIEDALLKDGTPFGKSALWDQLAASQRRKLTALMAHCPTAILLGSWASRAKNPQVTTRLARILTSEVIGVGCVHGARAAGRIDVHNVSSAITLYVGEKARVATDPKEARGGLKSPEKFPTKAKGDVGKPSAAGYGNVTPALEHRGVPVHGGVTIEYALQIATLSLPALRECRFPQNGELSPERDVAGRVMLAALGLHMLALQVSHGYDLRSGCLLVPEGEPTFELLDRLGQAVVSWPAIALPTHELLGAATDEGRSQGIDWSNGDIHLQASEAQLDLLRQSLEHAEAEGE